MLQLCTYVEKLRHYENDICSDANCQGVQCSICLIIFGFSGQDLIVKMIHAVNRIFKEYDVHLASASPRRKTILEHVGMIFTITPSTFEENLDKSKFSHPQDYAMENARCKALEVMERLKEEQQTEKPFIVIGTDTVVVAENMILEKPHTNENALQMLRTLNNLKVHEVYSGVAIVKYKDNKHDIRQFFEVTQVEFGDNPDEIIQEYANSSESLDKAGAYGIQDVGSTLIKKVNGCYFNVMGFPLYKFCREVYDWMME